MSMNSDDSSDPVEAATQNKNVTSKYTVVFLDMQKGLASMLHDGVGTDFEVKVEDQTFRCHKAVLASVSDFFRAMIQSGMKEAYENHATLDSVSPVAFKVILDILYLKDGDVDPLENKSDDELGELLRVADMLQIKFLRKLCLDLFEKTMTAENCIVRLKIAKDIVNDDLRNVAYLVYIKNFEKIAEVSTMSSLEYEDFSKVIASTDLVVKNEISVWRAIVKWINFSPLIRLKKLGELLKVCCLEEIELKFLTEEIAFDFRVRHNEVASDAVQAAIRYLNHPGSHGNCYKQHRECLGKEQITLLLGFLDDDKTMYMIGDSQRQDTWSVMAVRRLGQTRAFACCVHGRDVYVSGGTGSHGNLMHTFSGLTNKWTLCNNEMPVKLKRHAMVATDDSLYLVGGHSQGVVNASVLCSSVHCNRVVSAYEIHRHLRLYCNELMCYCLDSEEWYFHGKIPAPVENTSAVCVRDKIYIFGGKLRDSDSERSTDCKQMYDTNTESGTVLPCHLPSPCAFSRAVVAEDQIVIIVTDKGEVVRFIVPFLEPELAASVPEFNVHKCFGISMKSFDKLAIYGGVSVDDRGNEIISNKTIHFDLTSGDIVNEMILPDSFRLYGTVNVVIQSAFLIQTNCSKCSKSNKAMDLTL